MYNEDAPLATNKLISWNDSKGNLNFGVNRKKLRSKQYKRIGLHLIINPNNMQGDEDSPKLINCKGCEKNIDNKNERCLDNEYYRELIYIEETIKEKDLKIEIRMANKDLDYNDNIKKMIKNRKSIKEKEEEVEEINLEETYLIKKEFNLNWQNIPIPGGYRQWKVETWDHIWKCKENDNTLRGVIEEAIYLKTEEIRQAADMEKILTFHKIFNLFVEILYTNSLILKKEEQPLIRELWESIYDHIRTTIWKSRCDQVIAIEKDKGIMKIDKRKRKEASNADKETKKKKIKPPDKIEKTKKIHL
ncbi:hypothetical protein GLOIN_2v1771844 [Rhizophagus clarus]|uniref:Uncharacterized protein n=1 Tax=Rhizophagus clarus TaxID=94130 RepID=A0A8H3KVR3_9GLOM|nr:hypothetical protein GLOIN_2v1771844 [Rhizophagus clarus]